MKIINFEEFSQINEAFDTIKPKPIQFGSNADWDDPNPYTNGKFENIIGIYRTVFNLEGIFFQILFERMTGEVSFRVSETEDLTKFTDEPIGVGVNIQVLFSHILYVISKLIIQLRPPKIIFTSKSHTKKLYAGFYKSKSLEDEAKKLGYSSAKKESMPDGSDKYTYEFNK